MKTSVFACLIPLLGYPTKCVRFMVVQEKIENRLVPLKYVNEAGIWMGIASALMPINKRSAPRSKQFKWRGLLGAECALRAIEWMAISLWSQKFITLSV